MKKHCLQLFAFMLLAGMALPSFAQQPERQARKERREKPSPENNARRIMKDFKQLFRLTDKEYDKVYDLYLNQEKAMMPPQFGNGNMPPRREGMGFPPMGGGMPPMGGGMPSFGGGPEMGGGNMPADFKSMMEEMRKQQQAKREKAAKKLSKKMKKILDENQYVQWQEWENMRISKQKPMEFEFPGGLK